MNVPLVSLNDGKSAIPQIGLGTWESPAAEVKAAVEHAIKIGYRHIDTALIYGNEAPIGEAIAAQIAAGTVKREDLFIVTKLWCSYHEPAKVRDCVNVSLRNLQLSHIDLYLIHNPVALRFRGDDKLFPRDAEGKPEFVKSDHAGIWRELERCVDDGLLRSIGVSNFNAKQLAALLPACRIKPAAQEVECHVHFPQEEMQKLCQENGITMIAYSPLGRGAPSASASAPTPGSTPKADEAPVLLDNAILKEIAAKHGKSVAQVALRWLVQRGMVVIPKSVTPKRIGENASIFDFKLADEEMEKINAIGRERPYRFVKLPVFATAPDVAF